MATQVFKGEVRTGDIVAEYAAESANAGSDVLSIHYLPDGGPPVSDLAAVVPGGTQTVHVVAPKSGMLEVWISASTNESKGQLTVRRNGAQVDSDATEGSIRWGYSVAVGK